MSYVEPIVVRPFSGLKSASLAQFGSAWLGSAHHSTLVMRLKKHAIPRIFSRESLSLKIDVQASGPFSEVPKKNLLIRVG